MANVQEVTETTSAEVQKRTYNSASSMIKRVTFSPSADTAYAIVACVMHPTATVGDLDTIVTNLELESEITSVVDELIWGQTPASLEAADHEWRLYVSLASSGTRGFSGDEYNWNQRRSKFKVIPDSTKWCVFPLVLPSELDGTAAVAALEAAMEGVTGITTAVPMVYGAVPSDATGVTINYEGRVRIDPVPVP